MSQDAAVPGLESSHAESEHLELLKEYLSDPRHRVKLDDLVNASVSNAICETSQEKFPLDRPVTTGQAVAEQLKAYEQAIRVVQASVSLLGKWATAEQKPTLAGAVVRLSDNCVVGQGGGTVCLSLRWYPLSLLAYSAGIAALSTENYAAFAAVHTQRIDTRTHRRGSTDVPIIVPVVDAMRELAQHNVWKCLPGLARSYTPESDYLLATLRPLLDELLFLGGRYEQLFDRYEVLRALMYADLTDSGWGVIGRFGTKHARSMGDGSPYTALRDEAGQQRDQWGPIKAGLFRGTYTRFEQVATKFEGLLNGLSRF